MSKSSRLGISTIQFMWLAKPKSEKMKIKIIILIYIILHIYKFSILLYTYRYRIFGQVPSKRTAEDTAFSVARWFSRNGSYVNYYMASKLTNMIDSVQNTLFFSL